MFDTYHLSRKNASFRFVIWHGHLWGGRFQMVGVGNASFPAGMAGGHQIKKDGYGLNMEGFWLSDKFRVRAMIFL